MLRISGFDLEVSHEPEIYHQVAYTVSQISKAENKKHAKVEDDIHTMKDLRYDKPELTTEWVATH